MLYNPSTIAAAVLVLWLPLSIVLFTLFSPQRAAVLSFLLGVLYLPSGQALLLPVLPDITRKTMPALAVLLGSFLLGRNFLSRARIDGPSKFFFFCLVISSVLRVSANGSPLRYGPLVVPALLPQNVITFILEDMLTLGVPFFLGSALGRNPSHVQLLLRTWVSVALVYMLFGLIEVRMSPQIHVWVYGYFQHSFEQMVRAGGYRPIVFMEHGLEFALFTSGAYLIARVIGPFGKKIYGVTVNKLSLALFVFVILCKSMAAMTYAVVGTVLFRWTGPKVRVICAAVLAAIVLINPLTRMMDWVPTEELVETLAEVNPDRAASLKFRFDNEDRLLEKARQRPWTGWGGFARIRVYDQWGRDLSVTDGSWIIAFGEGGFPRFLAIFGLLTWPILFTWRKFKSVQDPVKREIVSKLALITAFFVLDLVPNSFFNYLSMLLAGLLLGMVRSSAPSGSRGRVSGDELDYRSVFGV